MNPNGHGLIIDVPVETLETRVADLERKLDTVIWLHAELTYGLRLAMAAQYAQQIQPQVQQAILDRLMAGTQ